MGLVPMGPTKEVVMRHPIFRGSPTAAKVDCLLHTCPFYVKLYPVIHAFVCLVRFHPGTFSLRMSVGVVWGVFSLSLPLPTIRGSPSTKRPPCCN